MLNRILYLLMLVVIVGCDSNRTYDSYVSVKNNCWLQEDEVTFDIPITDTIQRQHVFINIRNNKDYEFSNLYLIASMQFPEGMTVVDTLEYEMTDKQGYFLGSGYTDIKENKLFYKENVVFPTSGNYIFKVAHAMRKNGNIHGLDSLKGITDIGLRIESVTP